MTLKRGTRVEVTNGCGMIARGKVLRTYTPKEIAMHAKSHGQAAADDLPNWYPCEMTDEQGTYRLAFHVSALRVMESR